MAEARLNPATETLIEKEPALQSGRAGFLRTLKTENKNHDRTKQKNHSNSNQSVESDACRIVRHVWQQFEIEEGIH